MVGELPAVLSGVGRRSERGSLDASMGVRLAVPALGLACLAPILAWRGEAGVADAVVAVAFALAIVGVALTDAGRAATGSAWSGVAAGGLAACAIATVGSAAWPLALLLAAEPLQAFVTGRRSDAYAFLAGAVVGLGAVAWTGPLPPSPASGAFAAVALIALTVGGSVARLRVREAPIAAPPTGFDERLLEGACDLVTLHDGPGDVVWANGTAARLAGAPPRALRGGGLLARVHVSDRPVYLKALSDAANGAGPVTVEFRLHASSDANSDELEARKGGRVVSVEMRAVPFPHAGSGRSTARVIAFTRDNSAQRRHEEELERARREAEQASEMKGRFLATVSHELRTPLNAIIGFSELLAVDHPYVVTEERRREYAEIIRGSGHHLLSIVNTLLDMSKIETGNFPFEPEPFSLHELAASCCDLMQLKADEAGLRLARVLDETAPAILADRRACRQILINLLSNAVKFTPEGGVVTVSLAQAGESLALAVSDTGIGIPESDLPRLGDAFFQAGDLHRRTYEGTGLGLSVVRGLVGLHGGALAIESGSGQGTTVTVTLPLAAGREPAPPHPATVHAFPRRAVHNLERKSA